MSPQHVFKVRLQISITIAALLVLSISATGQSLYRELPVFTQVDERLFRGAQPREGGIRRLADLGINTIINLRGRNEQTRLDENAATALGLRYFNVPLPVWGRPKDEQTRRVLEIITARESGRTFIHCRDGVDRTGMIVALYRISQEGWPADAAKAEALNLGMRRIQVWMFDYIEDYYERQQLSATLGGSPLAPDDKDFADRIGVGVRVGERSVFSLRKHLGRVIRRMPSAVGAFLSKTF